MEQNKEEYKILYDIESGLPYRVSPEYYDSYMKMLNSIHQSLRETNPYIGQIFIFGTGGEITDNRNMKDMFYNPEGYKTFENLWDDNLNKE